jgi:hypothetical protein
MFPGALLAVGLLGGCDSRPTLFPNSDTDLQKTSMQFAADSAKRTYEASAPRGADSQCRAEVEYELGSGSVALTNVSAADLTNVELWINQKYVVFIPRIEKGTAKTIAFKMAFDSDGDYYVPDVSKTPTNLEIYHDGKMYTVPTVLPDH